MNVYILGNAMVVQRQNDQKVVSRAKAKAQQEWDKLINVAKQCPPFLKPNALSISLINSNVSLT
jgi:dsDNA-binding SOS-regulon protein